MKFLPKVVTVCFGETARFDCKNNHGCSKLPNFWLDIISKINYKMLVVMSYTSLEFWSKKSNWYGKTSNNLPHYYGYIIGSNFLLTFAFFP